MKKRIFLILIFLVIYQLIFAKTKEVILEARDLNGKNIIIDVNSIKKPLVILFWATWCLPCKEELKQMKKVYHQFKEKVDFYAIAVDDPRTVSKVNSYVRSNRLPYKVLLDTDQQIIRKFGGNVPPFSLVIDKRGKVVYTHSGYKKGDEKKLMKILKNLIRY
jgi:peroxiredoxin